MRVGWLSPGARPIAGLRLPWIRVRKREGRHHPVDAPVRRLDAPVRRVRRLALASPTAPCRRGAWTVAVPPGEVAQATVPSLR